MLVSYFYKIKWRQINSSQDQKIDYKLSQNYPNPFNPITKIQYSIPKTGAVSLKIFDLMGKEVKTLVNEIKAAGHHSFDFDGSNLASGSYYYQLHTGQFTETKKNDVDKIKGKFVIRDHGQFHGPFYFQKTPIPRMFLPWVTRGNRTLANGTTTQVREFLGL